MKRKHESLRSGVSMRVSRPIIVSDAPTAIVERGMYTQAQLARHLSVGTRSIRDWQLRGILPGVFHLGRSVRYDKGIIEQRILNGQLLLPEGNICRE